MSFQVVSNGISVFLFGRTHKQATLPIAVFELDTA